MFQRLTKIFSKPKPEFSRSKILSFIENYDYLKGRKDPGATGLITVLSESECSVNLKNDVSSFNKLGLLRQIIQAMNILSVKITNESGIRGFIHSFFQDQYVLTSKSSDPLEATFEAVLIDTYVREIFRTDEKQSILLFCQSLLRALIYSREIVSNVPSDYSCLHMMKYCIEIMDILKFDFDQTIKDAVVQKIQDFQIRDGVFQSSSPRTSHFVFSIDNESIHAFEILRIVDKKMSGKYYKAYVKQVYMKKHFGSLDPERRQQQLSSGHEVTLHDLFFSTQLIEFIDDYSSKETIQELYKYYDPQKGVFFDSPLFHGRGTSQDAKPSIDTTFIALEILSRVHYQFQS